MRIERVVVTGGRNFTDGARIEADLRALVPFDLRRVAQGGNGVPRPRGLPAGVPWVLSDGAAWVLTADIPRFGRSADALAWHAARAPTGQRGAGIKESATYFADWDTHGKGAGYRRNTKMLEAEKPDLVLAYPDPESRGTWHCVAEALRRGHEVIVWAPPPVVIPDAVLCLVTDRYRHRSPLGVVSPRTLLRPKVTTAADVLFWWSIVDAMEGATIPAVPPSSAAR